MTKTDDQSTAEHQEHGARPWSASIRGLKLSGLAWGDPNARPVLVLHGWQDNAASFIPMMSHIMGQTDALYVVAPDLPGHGQSAWRSHGSAYHFVDWVRDVHDILEALEWSRCSVMGHSMGAGIASLWAGVAPERCADLILIEGLGPMSAPAQDAPAQLARALQTPIHPFRERASLDELIDQRLALTPMRRESARCLMSRSTQVTDQGAVRLLQDPALRAPSLSRFTEEQVQAFLRGIRCKTLLIKADRGWPFDPTLMQQRLACLSHAELIELEGRHHVHMDRPAELARRCCEFWGLS